MPRRIMLVEDDEGDITLVTAALQDCGHAERPVVARTAAEAFALLDDEDRPELGLVLLDLNLPGGGGLVVLERLKDDPATRRWPVVVFSGSRSPHDVHRALDAYANAYVVKPDDFDELVATMRALTSVWLERAM